MGSSAGWKCGGPARRSLMAKSTIAIEKGARLAAIETDRDGLKVVPCYVSPGGGDPLYS
jgi:hypothetical protein